MVKIFRHAVRHAGVNRVVDRGKGGGHTSNILTGIYIITANTSNVRCDKSPTSKTYTAWARIFNDRYIFCTRGEGDQRRGLMSLGLFLFLIFPHCVNYSIIQKAKIFRWSKNRQHSHYHKKMRKHVHDFLIVRLFALQMMRYVKRAFTDASTIAIIWMEAFSVHAMLDMYWTKTTERVQVWYSS